jgi:protein TonB
MSTLNPVADLNDLIFLHKNKEYGAYVLRKNYSRYLTTAVIIAISAFILSISSPMIIAYFTPKTVVAKQKVKIIQYTDLAAPPSIDEKEKKIEKVEEVKQLKSTIAFRPPVIRPDDQVKDEYIPTQAELQKSEAGAQTVKGDANGVDLSLMEVQAEVPKEEKVEKAEVFTYVEEMPTFPGGGDAFLSYVAQKIVYPEIAKRAGVEGRVAVSFVVSPSGAVSNVEVMKGIGAGCDEEAIRVIKSMPKWNPGKQNGRPVNVKVFVPIVFKLQ